MFIDDVVSTMVDEEYIDENNKLNLDKNKFICYYDKEYYSLGENVYKFGYSIKKK